MPGYSQDPNRPLTPKMKRFCEEYIICGSAKKAYGIAFECEGTQNVCNGSRLLQNPRCQKYIKELQEIMKLNFIAEATEVLGLLTDIARNTEDEATKDRIKACELLLKSTGSLTEKKEVKISDSIDLEVSLESKSQAE